MPGDMTCSDNHLRRTNLAERCSTAHPGTLKGIGRTAAPVTRSQMSGSSLLTGTRMAKGSAVPERAASTTPKRTSFISTKGAGGGGGGESFPNRAASDTGKRQASILSPKGAASPVDFHAAVRPKWRLLRIDFHASAPQSAPFVSHSCIL